MATLGYPVREVHMPRLVPFRSHPPSSLAAALVAVAAMACGCSGSSASDSAAANANRGNVTMREARVGYLHHSTGWNVWNGGVGEFVRSWNAEHGTGYRITEMNYPATTGGRPRFLRHLGARYPWANYPYDYWNLWIDHGGTRRDRGELNLDDLVAKYDVIVLKHCFPVASIVSDDGKPSVSSQARTLANYRLQYQALKAKMRSHPSTRFIVWTGPALTEATTNPADAARAREFVQWVKTSWDEPGDNVYLWDFHELETDGGLYLKPEYAMGSADSHPNPAFSKKVAPLIGRRIVDVIEGRGDTGSITGR